MVQGPLRVLEDPHRFLDVVLSATDEVTVLQALHEQFGLDEFQAKAVIDMQFRLMTGRTRQLLRDEADMLRRVGDR
jgi:DNA gyrase/topoisomerase IV subunit A